MLGLSVKTLATEKLLKLSVQKEAEATTFHVPNNHKGWEHIMTLQKLANNVQAIMHCTAYSLPAATVTDR